jgi:hypothetical protein
MVVVKEGLYRKRWNRNMQVGINRNECKNGGDAHFPALWEPLYKYARNAYNT